MLFNTERPKRFEDLAGQNETKTALKNGLLKGHLEHSLIFYGKSGSGKTTAARIVGRYMNCENPINGEPCCKCKACTSFDSEVFPDYEELNAAIHGGKEDIDNLLADISYLPVSGKKKIYVIDEAQQLSSSAWSSLLKDIEEPPAHVIIILCTTNPETIPEAIKNRCGKYLFKCISQNDILEYLKMLNNKYNFKYSDKALEKIAVTSEGSMRDAINNFEHIRIPYENNAIIDVDCVDNYLSVLRTDVIATLIIAISLGSMTSAMNIIAEAESSAIPAKSLYTGITKMISKAITIFCGGVVDTDADIIADIKRYTSLERLIDCAQVINSNNQYDYSGLRLSIAQLCTSVPCDTDKANNYNNFLKKELDDALKRISSLENQIANANYNISPAAISNDYSSGILMETPASENINKEENIEESFNEGLFSQLFSFNSENSELSTENKAIESNEKEYPDEYSNEAFDNMHFDNDDNNESLSIINSDGCSIALDANVFNEYNNSNSIINIAEGNLNSIMSENELLNAIIENNCVIDKADDVLQIKTPFKPCADIIKVYLQYYNIENITVKHCECMEF